MLTFSPEIKDISAAIAKAQAEVENASKNAANPHFRSKYADLAEVLNVCRPVFAKHGLAITQHPALADGIVYVTTLISHSSGQWLQSCVSAPVGKMDAQGVGSAITYCRRYSLAAICGVAQEDDDANAAVGKPAKEKSEPPKAEMDPAIVAELENAPDLKALAKVWSGINVAVRHDYAAIKDRCKAKLQEAANATVE